MSMRIGYRDLWSGGTIIGYSSQGPAWPAEDTQIDDLGMAWRSTSLGSPDYISNDFGNDSSPADMFAILGHNFTSDADINLVGADDDAFTENVVTEPITWAAGNIYGLMSAMRTKRYWKLTVTDASNSDGFVRVAVIRVYSSWILSRMYLTDHPEGSDTVSQSNESGNRGVFGDLRPVLGTKSLIFEGMYSYEGETILDLAKTVDALGLCFIIIEDDADPADSGWFGYLVSLDGYNTPSYNYVNFTLNIREAAE